MLEINIKKIKTAIERSGLKQKYISEKMNISEPQLSLALTGRRRFEAGEYASLCKILNVPMNEFLVEADKKVG